MMWYFLAILWFLSGCLVGRVIRVHTFRMKLLAQISKLGDRDIGAGREWRWRYDLYEAVSFEEHVFKFWRPADSFHDIGTMLGPVQEHIAREWERVE